MPGRLSTAPPTCPDHDASTGDGRLAATAVSISCGTADPFLANDRALAAHLPHRPAGEFVAGCHDEDFWRRMLPAQVRFVGRNLGELVRLTPQRRRVQDPAEDRAAPGRDPPRRFARRARSPTPAGRPGSGPAPPPPGGEPHELRTPVVRVLRVADEALALELVGDALDALAGEAPRPRDLGDAHRRRLDGGEHAPAGARLAGRARERVARGREGPLEAEHERRRAGSRLALG